MVVVMMLLLLYLSVFYILGNEARHFTIKDNTPDNVALGVAPAPVVYNYTVLQGVDVPFVG